MKLKSSNIIDQHQEALNTLPKGHYKIQETAAVINKEYELSRKNANSWLKKIGKRNIKKYFRGWRGIGPEQARDLTERLCQHLGEKKIPTVFFNSPAARPGTAGVASLVKNEVHFPYWTTSLSTLIHELAHCLGKVRGHGKEFVEIESLLYQVLIEDILPKLKEERAKSYLEGII